MAKNKRSGRARARRRLVRQPYDSVQDVVDELAGRDADVAFRCWVYILQLAGTGKVARELGSAIYVGRDLIRSLLVERWRLAEVVLKTMRDHEALLNPEWALHGIVHLNRAMIWSLLRHELRRATRSRPTRDQALVDELLQLLGTGIHHEMQGFVERSRPQVNALFAALKAIAATCRERPRVRRVLLVECPVGNSIPVRILERLLLDAQVPFETLVIALNRNDKEAVGIRRHDLIRERLEKARACDVDLVVYADEWVTGVNFRVVSSIIDKVCRDAGAEFLPCALLAESARKDGRFASQCRNHDRICRRNGFDGSRLRFELPSLNQAGPVGDGKAFFWAEHDRLAGYRKIQMLGSTASGLHDAMKELRDNPALLGEAYAIATPHIVASDEDFRRIRNAAGSGILHLVFARSVERLDEWMDAVARLELASNTAFAMDPEDAMDELAPALGKTILEYGLMSAAQLALFWIGRHGLDRGDPFKYKHHVPLLSRLEGDLGAIHDSLLGLLFAEIGAPA